LAENDPHAKETLATLVEENKDALDRFLLEVASRNFGDILAISLDDETPTVFDMELVPGEDGELSAVHLKVDGLGPIRSIDHPKERLAELRRNGSEKQSAAQGLLTMLKLSASQADASMAAYLQEKRAPIGHVLPVSALGSISTPRQFLAHVQILIQQGLQARKQPGFKNDTFLLTGLDKLTPVQRAAVVQAVTQANATVSDGSPAFQLGDAPPFNGVRVQYVLADGLDQLPKAEPNTLYLPISGVDADALLGWYDVILIGGALGGSYDVESHRLDVDKIDGAFSFMNAKTAEKIPSKTDLSRLVTLNLDAETALDEFYRYRVLLPLVRRIPVEAFIQGARLALRSVGISA
jgi:hypothetical protein